MSNILIIKHGSLGDIAQACGAIQDISNNHKNSDIFILTTKPYVELFKNHPNIKDTILDKRNSRFNLVYLYLLMRQIKKYKFIKIFDLQNSSRTSFYKKILFPNSDFNIWSSSETTLPNNVTKEEFDKNPVLERFEHQLNVSGLKTHYTISPDFSWSCVNIDKIKLDFELNKYIVLFPFCSPHLTIKKWPYYNELIDKINKKFPSKYKFVTAPGPNEIDQAKNINALTILNKDKHLNIMELSSLIKESSFVIGNDTGPAHMAAHLKVNGISLFGSHTTAKKVSIETEKFKAIQVADLTKLSAEKVLSKIEEKI